MRWEFRPARRTDSSDLPLGVIHAMPGAEAEHSAFTVDVLTGPMNALDRAGEQGCRVFNCLMRFHTPDGRNTYPDIAHEGFDAAIVLPDLSVSLALADFYAKMDFEEAGLCHSVDSPNRVY